MDTIAALFGVKPDDSAGTVTLGDERAATGAPFGVVMHDNHGRKRTDRHANFSV
nr:hypothetical protein OHB51_32090 [Micromonospora sp. NBC_00855]